MIGFTERTSNDWDQCITGRYSVQ